jgi:hypothetical protein
MKTRRSSAWLALLLSFLVTLPPAAFGDDTELFTTSANPNVLLMLDTTGSMDAVAGTSSVGELDGSSPSNSRMDVLWKVVYTLLNADLSVPDSIVSATGTLGGARTTSGNWDTNGRVISGGSTTYNRIRLANFSSTEFNALPDSGTVVLGSGSTQDTVAYTSKGYSSFGGYYYLNFNSRTFASDWSVGDQIAFSSSGSYSNNFPTNHAEATSTDFLNNLTAADDNILKARLGLMTFTTNSTATSIQINIRNQVTSAAPNSPPFSPTYQNIWSSVTNYANASGGTPTAQALRQAQTFFDTAYNNSEVCRPNFAVMITDGEDTMGGLDGATGNGFAPDYYNGGVFNANGWPTGSNTGQVNRNNAIIQEAADLLTHNPSVKLFTVGVGISDTTPDKNVLREVLRRSAEQQNATADLAQYNTIGANGDSTSRGAGRAFFATDATELSTALRNVFHQITSGSYSFTAPTVASVRMTDRNYLYKALFVPAAPPATFWEGHLQAFTTDDLDHYLWDADNVLRSVSPSDRRIYAGYTIDNTTWSRREFTTSDSTGITPAMLGVDNTQARDNVVDYVLGVGHDNNAKLGDIFHSKPVVVGPPSRFFFDEGYSTPPGSGFADAKATRRRVIYVGTNDGMLHAFLSGTYNPVTELYDGGTGQELFGFVPYSLLNSIPDFLPGSLTTHEYYVDSSPRIADVWIPSNDTDVTKDPSEWRTVLISGLRKGGDGYFALDITDPPTGDVTSLSAYTNYPKVLWEYTDADHLGETWSEPFIGKVRMREDAISAVKDRWVAIFGGGKSDGTTATSLTVLDIATGTALKTFTTGTIDNGIVASPTAVLDAAGYIKMIYVNDLDGSLYKFNFLQTGVRSDGFTAWTVNKIFQPGAGQPVYHRVEAGAVDENTRYLFFGTGNQESPISDGGTGKFYAVKDTDTDNTLRTEGNLTNVTSNLGSGTVAPSLYGWVVNLASIPSGANSIDVSNNHSGEKVLSDPVVFFNNVFFTTFTPDASNPCSGGGIARVYGLQTLNAKSGLFALPPESGTKVPYHIYTGSEGGIPSSPSLSIYPSGQSSLFIGFSTGSIKEIKIDSPLHMKTIKSWKETF